MFRINPFDQREKFFVLIVSADKISAVLFAVSRDRVIRCEKFWPEFKFNQSNKWWPGILSRWTIIVAASSSLSYTANVSLSVERIPENRSRLSFSELENLLSREMNQKFITYRKVAAHSLKTSDLDTVLADSRVVDFKIDNHRVHLPFDFNPRHIETMMEMTFIHRTLYDLIRPLSYRSRFFFTGLPRAKLTVLEKVYRPPFALIVFESPHSAFFQLVGSSSEKRIEHREISWSAKRFLEVCMNMWGVNEDMARDIIHLYEDRKLPNEVLNNLDKEFRRVYRELDDSISGLLPKARLLMTNQEEMPQMPNAPVFEKVSVPLIAERMGFSFENDYLPIPEHEQFSFYAPLFSFFSDQGNPDMNRWVRRRLHWLGSMNYN